MNPKNRQLLLTVVWFLLALLTLYRLLAGDFDHDGLRRALGIAAAASFAMLYMDGFLRYRKM